MIEKTFSSEFDNYSWDVVGADILAKSTIDVERALSSENCTLEDFKALISPAAEPYVEQMAQLSHLKTQKRFGKTIQMYVPLYLSNECQNICTYCGFSLDNPIPRKTLSDKEIIKEAEAIKKLGYDHILLVTGEANKTVGVPYIKNAIQLLKLYFSHISIEVQPLEEKEYEELISEGLNTVLLYQETYNETNYKVHHPKGKKSNFRYRLESHDRVGKAGIYKMGVGVLLGLEDWRTDSFFTALHLQYLEKSYWQSKYSVSFPRLRPCEGTLQPKSIMTDKQLIQLICAYRIFDEEVELSMSTRESETFRNNVVKLGVTTFSAESRTQPGGYAEENGSLEQFEIDDKRSTEKVSQMIQDQGYDVVWKDWDASFQI